MKLARLARKLLASMTLAAMICTTINTADAAPAYDMNGNGYVASRGSPCLTPAIALGTIAVIAIVVVALQNTSGHSSHSCHSGCGS
jgi:type IV secretory pathway VirB2 component (pilin)